MEDNNDYGFEKLRNIQDILFFSALVIYFVILLKGGVFLVNYLNKQLYKTKRSLTVLSLEIIMENPYFISYV